MDHVGAGPRQDLDLLVRHVEHVDEDHVGSEGAESLEVLDRGQPGPLPDALDLFGEGALVHVEEGAVLVGQLLRLHDQGVRAPPQPDDVDTGADEAVGEAARVRLHDGRVLADALLRGLGEGRVAEVHVVEGAAALEAPEPDLRDRLEHGPRVVGAGGEIGRAAALHQLDEHEVGRPDLVFHGEDRRHARVDEVRPLVAVEAVRRHPAVHVVVEVDVGVHEARRDDVVARIQDAPAAIPGAERLPLADGGDPVAGHGDGAVADDSPRRVHGDDGCPLDEQVNGYQLRHVSPSIASAGSFPARGPPRSTVRPVSRSRRLSASGSCSGAILSTVSWL